MARGHLRTKGAGETERRPLPRWFGLPGAIAPKNTQGAALAELGDVVHRVNGLSVHLGQRLEYQPLAPLAVDRIVEQPRSATLSYHVDLRQASQLHHK